MKVLRQQRFNKEIEGQVDKMKEQGCTKCIVITTFREKFLIVEEGIIN
jgi:hypothetical protein